MTLRPADVSVISTWSFVNNSFFAIGNYKSVKYSFVVWPITAILFLISDYMYSSEVLYNLLGVLLGLFWGGTLPYARKKNGTLLLLLFSWDYLFLLTHLYLRRWGLLMHFKYYY